MKDYKRLTTDSPINNVESMLNFAYVKDKEVYLRYANGEEEKRLAEYIAELATAKGCECTAEDVSNEICGECDCEVAILNILAIQAAELRHRLAELEDKIESGKLVELPCIELFDTFCITNDGRFDKNITMAYLLQKENGRLQIDAYEIEEAEARLAELRGER